MFLDANLTSPFEFYQFWFNSADADVGKFLRWLTVRDKEEIAALEATPGAERRAQRALAEDLTRRVHGDEALAEVLRALESLFGGGDLRAVSGATLDAALGAAPAITVERARFEGEGALLVDLLAEVGACPSKSDARRQIAAGSIAVNGVPLADGSADSRVTAGDLIDGRLVDPPAGQAKQLRRPRPLAPPSSEAHAADVDRQVSLGRLRQRTCSVDDRVGVEQGEALAARRPETPEGRRNLRRDGDVDLGAEPWLAHGDLDPER